MRSASCFLCSPTRSKHGGLVVDATVLRIFIHSAYALHFVAIPVMWRRSRRGPSAIVPLGLVRNINCFGLLIVLLQSFFEAGRISTRVRNWLGHVSVDHRNIYAQLALETKAKAIARCEPEKIKPGKHWSTDKTLMSFLKSLWPSISYVAVEPVRAVPVAGFLNERHITGMATKRFDSP